MSRLSIDQQVLQEVDQVASEEEGGDDEALFVEASAGTNENDQANHEDDDLYARK